MKPVTKNCPMCGVQLTRFRIFGVDLDECPRCRGLWFDARELEKVKDELDRDLRWKDFDLAGYAARARFRPAGVACPACGVSLVEIRFDTTRVELSYCLACGGVWAEAGKLGKILAHMRREVEAEPSREMARDAWRNFLEIFHGGHKGAWEEMKDFAAAWRLLTLKFMIDHPGLANRLDTARRTLPF